MVAPGGLQRRESRTEVPDLAQLEHVAVGDADPTSPRSADNRHPLCRFEWADALSPTFVVPWSCTRQRNHHGQHIAGTGQRVAAVHPAQTTITTQPSQHQ